MIEVLRDCLVGMTLLGVTLAASGIQAAEPAPVFEFGANAPIGHWLLAAPFPSEGGGSPARDRYPSMGYYEDYLASIGGEAKARPTSGTVVQYKGVSPVFTLVASPKRGPLEWARGSGSHNGVAYAFCTVRAPKETEACLHVAGPWSNRLWLNGRLVYAYDPTDNGKKSRVFRVRLHKGDNALLAKSVTWNGRGGFGIRIVTPEQSHSLLKKESDGVLRIDTSASAPSGDQGKRKAGSLWKSAVTVDFEASPGLFPEVKARVAALDPKGKEIAKESCTLGKAVSLETPAGFVRLHVTVDDFFGRKLTGETMAAVGMDLRSEATAAAKRACAMKAMKKYQDSDGYLEYLASRIEEGLATPDTPEAKLCEYTSMLQDWIKKLESDPKTWSLQPRGDWMEWAYRSKVDGTAQPFMIHLPANYSARKPWPLHVFIRGYGGTHKTGGQFQPPPDGIVLKPYGRTRGTAYTALSEVDIYEAMDYVKANWSVDADRVHLVGNSIGGYGTFQIPARHPDWFASGRPLCGCGTHVPLENLLYVPFYLVHSADDLAVAIGMARASVREMNKLGGEAIMDETVGVGHRAGDYKLGVQRSAKWASAQHRPSSVARVHYTATDESARSAYWVEVVEWGSEGRPAVIDARMGAGNTLYLDLDNVGVARFDLAAAKADLKAPLMLVINDHIETELKAPLHSELFVTHGAKGWTASGKKPPAPSNRLHYPGGAMALYHGEPLMVVWGTRGGDAVTSRILSAARAAQRSASPTWQSFEPWEDVPMRSMPFGRIPGKADVDVTKEDMEKYNLLLIGDAQQNALVARMARQLPVRIEGGRAIANDGASWGFKDRALGLLYYNPLAPGRLIYWVASENPAFYRPGVQLMMGQDLNFFPPDLVVAGIEARTGVTARRFDSRWKWEAGYAASPLIKPESCTVEANLEFYADAIRRAADADFAYLRIDRASTMPGFAAGESRLADMLAWEYDGGLAVMDLTAAEIAKSAPELKRRSIIGYFPKPNGSLAANRTYRVVLDPWDLDYYNMATHENPASFRLIETTRREALQRKFLSVGLSGGKNLEVSTQQPKQGGAAENAEDAGEGGVE